MLNSKKIAQVIVISLLIVLGPLFQLAFQVSSVSAHEEENVHPYMSEEGAKLLPEDSAMREEIFSYISDIRDGAYDEDHTDHVYPHLTWAPLGLDDDFGIVAIPHFWDADEGPEDPVKGIPSTPWPGPFPNAYQKSIELFQMALDEYPINQGLAYDFLGHVAHLIQDQTVPAHVHEDFHPLTWLPGGDDSFENWMYESGAYRNWGTESAFAHGGLVTFPHDVEEQMRQGDWVAGLYYLMYTTNQYADYFASDDADGDTFDREGWMDYSDWPTSPRTTEDIENNDHGILGEVLGDDDNNRDGDLSMIASYSYVYGIRASGTLYKMFYESTHPPQASIRIDYADEDVDGRADYRWVRLDLTYDVGADEYFRDMEARFRNENGVWTSWEPVGAVAGGRRKSWVLSEGDGTKTVQYQVRNLMGLTTTVWDTIELRERGMPQLFNYEFSATGAESLTAQVDFYINLIWLREESGDGQVEFYFDRVFVDDGYGNELTGIINVPTTDFHFKIDEDVDFDLTSVNYFDGDIDYHGWLGIVWTDVDHDFSLVHSIDTFPGQTVRLRTRGRDYDPWPNPDDKLGSVWTRTFTVPDETGVHILANEWFDQRGSGGRNEYYSIQVTIVATVPEVLWSDSEGPYETFVRYGAPEEHIADSALLAPADERWPYPHTTEWQASIDNSAVEHRMDGPSLYAWITGEPDLVVGGFSPVHLLITDPDGNKIGTRRYIRYGVWDPWLGMFVAIWGTETFNEVPGASVSQIDLDGDGVLETVIVFDERKVGDYQIQVSPIEGADPTDTYSIGISWKWYGPLIIGQPPPRPAAFLVEDVQVAEIPAEPFVIQSTEGGFWSAKGRVNLPPCAESNGPYKATEGTTINFDASHSTDPDRDDLTYRWDFEDDGTWDTQWSNSPTASHTWFNEWTGTASVEVSDGTFTDTSTTTVTVSNALPTVNAGSDQLAAPSEEVHFSGSFTDQGVADTHTIEWNLGDGTTATGTLTPTHTYSGAKKYTVTLTVTDDNGGVGRDTLTVNTGVEVSIDPLAAFVPPGENTTYNVLITHLGNAEDTYNLEVGGPHDTWYSLSTTSVTLGPGQSESVTLTVSPPYTAMIGTYGFAVVATSQADSTVLGTADAEMIVALPDVEVVAPLDVEVDVGAIHFRGEMAEFYVLVSSMGQPIDANISARLRAHGIHDVDLSASVEHVTRGLYRVPYTIPADAPTGTYVLVVEASYLTFTGISLKSFLIRSSTTPFPAWIIATVVVIVAVPTVIAFYILRIRKQRIAS